MNNVFSLKNKVAVVTGGSKGIGAAIANSFAIAGAKVHIIARNEKDLKKTCNKINKKSHLKVNYIVCDINNINEFNKKISALKKIEIFVNNAGINIPKHFLKVQSKDLDYMISLNLRSLFLVTQIIVKKMIKQKNIKTNNSNIINISSTLGHVGSYDRTVYCMTKFGIEGFTKSLAIDLAKYKIRVNAIAPTAIMTPMLKKYYNKDFEKKTLPNILLNRIGEVNDVASTAVYLASKAAQFITGTSILVDGGWTAK
tara:strand:- start:1069 stop:1833 length:765 start_codon:yes stop_codon:yes gene_type:complete